MSIRGLDDEGAQAFRTGLILGGILTALIMAAITGWLAVWLC